MDAKTLQWLDGLYSRSFSGDGEAFKEFARVWSLTDYLVPPEESAVSRASSTVLVKIGD